MQTIIEKELALHEYEVNRDKDEVAKLLHPDFKEVEASGISLDLISTLNLLGDAETNQSKLHSQDYETIQLAPDVYLLLYNSALTDRKGRFSRFVKRSSIWSLTEQGWKMKYHQGTPCEPFTIKR